jgi:hypothetical protein
MVEMFRNLNTREDLASAGGDQVLGARN